MFWNIISAKVVYITAMIILHLILHSAVHIYDFHIFKTYVYSVRCHKNLFKKIYPKRGQNRNFSNPDRMLVGIRDFMQYRENPEQTGMVGQSSLCEKTKELNINVTYSLWILLKWVGFFLPRSHIGQDSGLHAISGESQSDWDGWTVFFMWEEDKRT